MVWYDPKPETMRAAVSLSSGTPVTVARQQQPSSLSNKPYPF